MTKNRTRLERIQRELDRRAAAAEPVVISIVWHDEATGEDEAAGGLVVDSRRPAKVIDYRAGLAEEPKVLQLRWPEDEDAQKQARDVALGRA